jgi:hypothetical protein
MIGEHVIGRNEGRQALVQTLDGQAIRGVNAGRPQDRDLDASLLAPAAQATFGIDPSARIAYSNEGYSSPKKSGAMRRAFDKIFGK